MEIKIVASGIINCITPSIIDIVIIHFFCPYLIYNSYEHLSLDIYMINLMKTKHDVFL